MIESRHQRRPSCFVIMPFGDKSDADGDHVNFNEIYTHLIKKTIEDLGIACIRSDEVGEAGWIHSSMFNHVYEADVAIVDITSLNPNVFYELGVRHALAEHVTVIIRGSGTSMPFDIQDLNVIEYDPGSMTSVEEAKKKIADHVRNGLTLRKVDSPVREVLDIRVDSTSKRLSKTESFNYQLRKVPKKRVGLITGDLRDVKGVDVWVNSENTNMQMARHFDRSISSVIRYYGAKRSGGRVIDDLIANELALVAGENANVHPGEVLATGSGQLQLTHGVKRIFHAAAVFGQIGKGYIAIPDVTDCVRNALELADSDEFDKLKLKTILFPIMGTGTGGAGLEQKARELIYAAINHLASNPACRIDAVYFLVPTEKDLAACQQILQEAPEVRIGKERLRSGAQESGSVGEGSAVEPPA
jgi:O-acetyl-ADP-ribose deacetylase (regulator of RNase III)